MNRQRLLELAGISSNMNNPSQEPYTEIPASAESPTDAPGTEGYDELGDSEEMDPIAEMRRLAERGAESPEEAVMAIEAIQAILDKMERIEDKDEDNGEEDRA